MEINIDIYDTNVALIIGIVIGIVVLGIVMLKVLKRK